MANPFVGEIRVFPFNFAPTGWFTCSGQLLPISQYTALFSLLGTNFGGDGETNFGLPNLRGNAPMFWGQGPGLSLYDIGEIGGAPTVTLLETELPAHSHILNGNNNHATSSSPNGTMVAVPAVQGRLAPAMYAPNVAATSPMLANNALAAGGSQPHNNRQPYLVMTFCIAYQGIFPSRD
jgi:microcystin-dependent protein